MWQHNKFNNWTMQNKRQTIKIERIDKTLDENRNVFGNNI
jgi:hypothetical protein